MLEHIPTYLGTPIRCRDEYVRCDPHANLVSIAICFDEGGIRTLTASVCEVRGGAQDPWLLTPTDPR